MKNRNLWILFVGLLALYLGSQFFSGEKKTRSFDPNLFPVDTSAIDLIEVHSKSDDFAQIKLARTANGWTASNGTVTTAAQANIINATLGQMVQAKATRIAAKSKEKWTNFEIDEATAKSHIKAFAGGKLQADFWVGGFRFNNETRQGTSFIRKSDNDAVYAVDGFISMSLGQGFSGYRNNSMIKFNELDITKLSVQQDGQSANYQRAANQWINANGETMDSTKMTNYLKGLANFTASKFADDFQETDAAITSHQSLRIEANNGSAPITINCYQVSGRENPYICQSSTTPDTWFAGDSTSFYAKLFKTEPELK